MAEDGQYDPNMYNLLKRLIKFVVVDAARISNCNMIYNDMNCTKKKLIQCITRLQIHFISIVKPTRCTISQIYFILE